MALWTERCEPRLVSSHYENLRSPAKSLKCVSPADVGADGNYFTLIPATLGGFVMDEPVLDIVVKDYRTILFKGKLKISFLKLLKLVFVLS